MKKVKSNEFREYKSFSAEDIIRERAERQIILQNFATDYYRAVDPKTDESSLITIFDLKKDDCQTIELLHFVMESFRPTDESRETMHRKDGNLLVTHSLELFAKAKSFEIKNNDVYRTVLLHDVLEDTNSTLADVKGLADNLNDPHLVALVKTMTEERSPGLSRDDSVVKFAQQLREAPDVFEGKKAVVIQSELLDRIDDLSDLGYITQEFEGNDSDRKIIAKQKLLDKLAKCQYTVDTCTEGCKDADVARLLLAFNTLIQYHLRVHGITKQQVTARVEEQYRSEASGRV